MLDPQAKYLEVFADEETKKEGKLLGLQWDITTGTVPEPVASAFSKFHSIQSRQPCNFTIIRLPLRPPSLAAESKVTTRPYTKEDVLRMFQLLAAELPHLLLFLKYVSRISVSIIE